jgi:transaldolase
MSGVDQLREQGQHVWLDQISRSMLDEGRLLQLRVECGITGITANPTIYETALVEEAYCGPIAARARSVIDPEELFWDLAVDDIRRAADLLVDRYVDSHGLDGLVSLELSPHVADDTSATIEAGLYLFHRLDRANVMIKVPGTTAGIPAIEELTARGVNVNVTLLFGPDQCRRAWEAYCRGLERRHETGRPLEVSSVASFFLSRIDQKLNGRLPPHLRDRAAIAAATVIRAQWSERLASGRWTRLAELGARPQELLWASTSVKSSDLAETYYVERLVAPETVTTVPRRTLEALCHSERLEIARLDDASTEAACRLIDEIEGVTEPLDVVAAELQREGVEKFADSFDGILDHLDKAVRPRAVAPR